MNIYLIQKKLFFIHVIAPFSTGLGIYLFFRNENYLFHFWNYIPIFKNIEVASLILYNLPDGLWLYSLIWILIIIWKLVISRWLSIYIFFSFILSIVMEFGQAYNIIKSLKSGKKQDLLKGSIFFENVIGYYSC